MSIQSEHRDIPLLHPTSLAWALSHPVYVSLLMMHIFVELLTYLYWNSSIPCSLLNCPPALPEWTQARERPHFQVIHQFRGLALHPQYSMLSSPMLSCSCLAHYSNIMISACFSQCCTRCLQHRVDLSSCCPRHLRPPMVDELVDEWVAQSCDESSADHLSAPKVVRKRVARW